MEGTDVQITVEQFLTISQPTWRKTILMPPVISLVGHER
jgi:hypothetical protein